MKKILIMTAALMLLYTQLYAGNGDLIVNGNLGVGTGTPSEKLEVVGKIKARNGFDQAGTGALTYTNDAGRLFIGPESGASSNGTYISINGKTAGTFLGIGDAWNDIIMLGGSAGPVLNVKGNTGNVGIGTMAPVTTLDIKGPSGDPILNADTNGIFTVRTGSDVQLQTGGLTYSPYSIWMQTKYAPNSGNYAYPLVLNPLAGNVGIGLTNPQSKLDVAGDIAINGVVKVASDIKFKKKIRPIEDSATKLLSLNGVSYEWKTDEYKDKGFPEGRHYGVIAQEIEKVLPEVVNTAPDGTKSVAYTEIIPVLIEAMKAQQVAMDMQKEAIGQQQMEINDLKALVSRLSAK